jgi:thiol-disulfide isomerase/thioredoxin
MGSFTTAICILVLLTASACFSPSIRRGVSAPTTIVSTLNGGDLDIAKYRGKVILLNFWASWCGPCVKELPELERLEKEIGRDEFLVLAVNKEEPIEKVKSFIGERRLGLTVLLDPQGVVSRSYGVRSLPANILIDREGKVRATGAGYTRRKLNGMRKHIKELIAEKQ